MLFLRWGVSRTVCVCVPHLQDIMQRRVNVQKAMLCVCVCVSVYYLYASHCFNTKLRLGEHHTHTHTHTHTHMLSSRCDPISLINTLYSWAPWALPMHTALCSLAHDLLLLTVMWALSRARVLVRTMWCVCTPCRQTEAHLNNDGLLWGPAALWRPLSVVTEMHPNVKITWNCAAFNPNEKLVLNKTWQ